MKKTTKALIAFLSIGYVIAVSITMWLAMNSTPFYYPIEVRETDKSLITRQLDGFSAIRFRSMDGRCSFHGDGRMGIVFREDSLVNTPKIMIPSAIEKMVRTSVRDGRLDIAFDYLAMADTTVDNARYWGFKIDVAVPVTVVMPRGSMNVLGIGNDVPAVINFVLDGLRSERFEYNGFFNVAFRNCRIDTLTNSSAATEYHRNPECILSFEGSRVSQMIVADCASDLKIRTDSLSVIDVLTRKAAGSKDAFLTISEARVGRLRWEPDSAENRLRLNVSAPFDFKFGGVDNN